MAATAKPLDNGFAKLVQQAGLAVLVLAALAAILYFMRPVLLPFVLSLFLLYALNPALIWLRRRLHIPPLLSISLIWCLFILFLAVMAWIMTGSVRQFIQGAGQYKERLSQLAATASPWLERLGLPTDMNGLESFAGELPLSKWAGLGMAWIFDALLLALLCSVFLFFLVAGRKAGRNTNSKELGRTLHEAVSRYLQVKILASLIVGAATWLILAGLGLELSALFGALAFFLNFIPGVGGTITVAATVPIALLQFGLDGRLLAVVVAQGLLQFLVGNFLETKFLGDRLGLHPVVVLLSLLFWGMLWGLPGMVLAVPLSSVMKVALESHPRTEPLARTMQGEML